MQTKQDEEKPGWRKFEQLLKRIETFHAPKGAVVSSPDYLPDLVTKSLREVDATVRYKVGTVDVVIAFECRKRGTKGDVTWIEQLAQKRANLGISSTVAVSEKGFTKEAMIKAKHLGIKTRVLNKIEDFNIESALILEIVATNVSFRNINLKFTNAVGLSHDELQSGKVYRIRGNAESLDQISLLMALVNAAKSDGSIPDYSRMPDKSKAFFHFKFKSNKHGLIGVIENGIFKNLEIVSADVIIESKKPRISKTGEYRYGDVEEEKKGNYLEFDVGEPENPDFIFLYNPESENPAFIFK